MENIDLSSLQYTRDCTSPDGIVRPCPTLMNILTAMWVTLCVVCQWYGTSFCPVDKHKLHTSSNMSHVKAPTANIPMARMAVRSPAVGIHTPTRESAALEGLYPPVTLDIVTCQSLKLFGNSSRSPSECRPII